MLMATEERGESATSQTALQHAVGLVFSSLPDYRESRGRRRDLSHLVSLPSTAGSGDRMATTAPIFDEAANQQVARIESPPELPGRVQRLEGELAELRDTVARFAEMIIGEVKVLRNSHAELPMLPTPGLGEGAINPVKSNGTDAAGLDHAGAPHRPWLLMELLRDFGTMVRMYLDPRYRVRRATQMLVPLILALFALNFFFFHYVFQIPFVSTTLEKLADVVLAILLYRVLSQELIRYRQTIAHLLAWQDYRPRSSAVVVNSEPPLTQLETE